MGHQTWLNFKKWDSYRIWINSQSWLRMIKIPLFYDCFNEIIRILIYFNFWPVGLKKRKLQVLLREKLIQKLKEKTFKKSWKLGQHKLSAKKVHEEAQQRKSHAKRMITVTLAKPKFRLAREIAWILSYLRPIKGIGSKGEKLSFYIHYIILYPFLFFYLHQPV